MRPEKTVFCKIPDASSPYCSMVNGNSKVIGEFVCDTFITDKTNGNDALFNAASCMSDAEIAVYCANKEMYGWHISDLKIYDKPKLLSDFKLWNRKYKIEKPPQSWCYVEEVSNEADNI